MANPGNNQLADTESQTETERLIDRNRKNGWKSLSAKKRAFALSYILSYDPVAAAKDARAAGDGNKYLRDPIVAAYISHLQDENFITNFITDDFIKTQYLNLIPKLMGQEEVPIVSPKGFHFNAPKFHPAEMIQVLKELRTMTDGYTGEKFDINVGFPDAFKKAMMGDA